MQQTLHPVSCCPLPQSLFSAYDLYLSPNVSLKATALPNYSSWPPMSGLQSKVLLASHGRQKEIIGQLVDSSVVLYFREKLKLFNTDGSRNINEQSTIWNKIVNHCLWLAVQTLIRKRSPCFHKVLTEDCKPASSEAVSPAGPGGRKVREPQIYRPGMGLDTKSNISYDFGH